ncbi:hypothetical protein BCR32DRAFT_246836 [Anaeromyces robustus]|uniref:RRM domain-containing protein n=1 Tax=Anaeromyces robustus TaxID=1754192 RepID=A0A1Y1WZ82_9FUNG|nr:hypothetical protein BCR32DRAFT_246836 [Anaeromyces robustus]|eukprot:ORX78879.1 hypothetical protein BCR32DRAFT_246836 [Anaeromyces robustus]
MENTNTETTTQALNQNNNTAVNGTANNNVNGTTNNNNKPKNTKKGGPRGYQYGKRDYYATGVRVSNLPENVDIETLTKYFSQFGKLNGVNIKNGPNDSKIAEIDFSQKGSASKSVNSLLNYDKDKALFEEKPTTVLLHWNDDNLDPFITAALNSSLPYNILSRSQKVFKRLLITPSPNTQLDKDVIEHLFQYYGKIVLHRFSPTSAHITYNSPQEGVNALFALDELVLPTTTLQIHFGRVEPLLSNWKEQRISLCISRLPLTAKRSHIKIACAGFGEVYIRPTFLPDNLPLRKRIYVDFVNQKEGKEALAGLQEHFIALGFYGVHVNIASNRLPNDNNAQANAAAAATAAAPTPAAAAPAASE